MADKKYDFDVRDQPQEEGLQSVPLVEAAALGPRVLTGLAGLAAKGYKYADEALLGERVSNQTFPHRLATKEEAEMYSGVGKTPSQQKLMQGAYGRLPTEQSQVTHVQRNMSLAELKDALSSGKFRVPKEGTKYSKFAENPKKWWSLADEEGVFGRVWPRGKGATVRLPYDKLPAKRAASIEHAEVLDPLTGEWIPIKEFGKKLAIGGVIIDEGNPAKRKRMI